MDKILEIISLQVLILSLLVALLQNIFVDIFKCGNNTHFKNTGVQTTKPKLINRLLLIVSAIIVFITLYATELLNTQEIVLTCILSTVLAWIFYKVNIYQQFMDLLVALKNGILNIIKRKFGE